MHHPIAHTRTAATATLVLTLALGGVVPAPASADIITANCTGMMDLKVHRFDTSLTRQDVAEIGTGDVTIDADAIVLKGAFGTYRFDLKVGTLYHDGRDTGLYCTYDTEKR